MNSTGVIIRPFIDTDLIKVGNVVKRSMAPSLENFPAETRLKYQRRNTGKQFLKGRENINFYIAEVKTNVIGVIGLDDTSIRTFYVDPTYQGKGIGRLLYNKVIEVATERKNV